MTIQDSIKPIEQYMQTVAGQARVAAVELARADRSQKDQALLRIADRLRASKSDLQQANARDLEQAQQRGLAPAMIDRLRLTDAGIEAMALGCEQVAGLEDPVGAIESLSTQASGIQVGKMRVPLGVIGIIYESRPNVTVDAAILCLKSGNAAVLRGGSESFHSNQAIARCLADALAETALPNHAVQVLATPDRAAVGALITASDWVDVIIPRGGKGLIERISSEATVPVIKHLDGICHVYIDAAAARDKAIGIAVNAKTHRYGVCNAMETLLFHVDQGASTLPTILAEYQRLGVECRVCERTLSVLNEELAQGLRLATTEDWATEYLAPIVSIKTVTSAEQAMQHIAQYGSAHTDAIVTEDHSLAMRFLREVDSASVMVNTSTRFADGFEYGLGAEIGISTDRLHVRGPVGLVGLTTQKYVVFGDGHVRS